MLIERERRGAVLQLRFNRPDWRNAMSYALVLELGRILESVSDAPDIGRAPV
jgi:enoyl-CoA hydratase/carnithine racemase